MEIRGAAAADYVQDAPTLNSSAREWSPFTRSAALRRNAVDALDARLRSGSSKLARALDIGAFVDRLVSGIAHQPESWHHAHAAP